MSLSRSFVSPAQSKGVSVPIIACSGAFVALVGCIGCGAASTEPLQSRVEGAQADERDAGNANGTSEPIGMAESHDAASSLGTSTSTDTPHLVVEPATSVSTAHDPSSDPRIAVPDARGLEPVLGEPSSPVAVADGGKLITESIVYSEGICLGEAVPEPCPDSAKSRAEGEGGCSDTPRPCDSWDEAECAHAPGCHWGEHEVINEGTDTGRSCSGTPIACGHIYPTFCNSGCEEHIVPDGQAGANRCTGTPDPCELFQYSEDCARQVGCSWK